MLFRSGAPNDGRSINVTYRYQSEGITGALSSGGEHWLQLTIDGDVQATRERGLAGPFALRAGTVDAVQRRGGKKYMMHAVVSRSACRSVERRVGARCRLYWSVFRQWSVALLACTVCCGGQRSYFLGWCGASCSR